MLPVLPCQRRGTRRPRRASRGSLLGLFVLLALVVVVAIVFGLRPRLAREKALSAASEAAEEKPPVVNVAPVRRSPSSSALELPGDLQANLEGPIFARADGFMTKRFVDYGDRVHAGQLLAEIDAAMQGKPPISDAIIEERREGP